MHEIIANSIGIAGFSIYLLMLLAAVSIPIWGYRLFEKHVLLKHEALQVVSKVDVSKRHHPASIIASIGTTTTGVFLIQALPLAFGIVNDVAGAFAVNTVYGEYIMSEGVGDSIDEFYAITAQLSDVLQTSAPMAAVGLGGYNLLNNISRGLPAIFSKKVS